MKVKLTVPRSGPAGAYNVGDVIDVPAPEAKRMMEADPPQAVPFFEEPPIELRMAPPNGDTNAGGEGEDTNAGGEGEDTNAGGEGEDTNAGGAGEESGAAPVADAPPARKRAAKGGKGAA